MSPPTASIVDISTEITGVDPTTGQNIGRVYILIRTSNGTLHVFLSKETLNIQDAVTSAADLKTQFGIT